MAEHRVRLIRHDADRAQWVRQRLSAVGVQSLLELAGARQLAAVLDDWGANLTLYYWNTGEDFSEIDSALHAISLSARPGPLVVVSDHYDASVALTLFRMGVTDYLGRDEHGDRFNAVIEGIIGLRGYGEREPSQTPRARGEEQVLAGSP